MPNRSSLNLPAIYTESTTDWDIASSGDKSPYFLDVFDVTYLHFHNTIEIGLCASGEGVCYVEDRQYPFKAGDIQIIFPFQRHLSKSTGPAPSQWYWLNLDAQRTLLKNGFSNISEIDRWLHHEMALCGIINRESYPEIAKLVERIIYINEDDIAGYKHKIHYLCANLYLLILELCEASKELEPLQLRSSRNFDTLLPALNHVKNGLEENFKPTVAELADLCRISVSQFRKVFSKTIGMSPLSYIRACSMRKARHLLLTSDESVLSIGLSVGFDNISGFNRCFASCVGITPSQYRKQYKNVAVSEIY
jgi:AraC-like DNA-binding protein